MNGPGDVLSGLLDAFQGLGIAMANYWLLTVGVPALLCAIAVVAGVGFLAGRWSRSRRQGGNGHW